MNFIGDLKYPLEFTMNQSISLTLKAMKYFIKNSNLCWKDPLNILLLCLTKSETEGVIEQFHGGICGGHYS